jgi:hypothetical protein
MLWDADVDGAKREDLAWGWNWQSGGASMGHRETFAHTRAAEKNCWKPDWQVETAGGA